MSQAKTMLLHLVADLIRSDAGLPLPQIPGLAAAFAGDATKTIAKYALNARNRDVLMSMDRQVLSECLRQEILHASTSVWGAAEEPTVDRASLLLSITADLIRDEIKVTTPAIPGDLAGTFKAKPDDVIAKYGLDAASAAVLKSGDREKIAEHVRRELLETESPPPQNLWAEPIPVVEVPAGLTLQAKPNQVLSMTTTCVLENAELHLQSDDLLNHYVFKAVFPSPIATAKAPVKLTLDLSAVKPDDYYVRVYNGRTATALIGTNPVKVT